MLTQEEFEYQLSRVLFPLGGQDSDVGLRSAMMTAFRTLNRDLEVQHDRVIADAQRYVDKMKKYCEEQGGIYFDLSKPKEKLGCAAMLRAEYATQRDALNALKMAREEVADNIGFEHDEHIRIFCDGNDVVCVTSCKDESSLSLVCGCVSAELMDASGYLRAAYHRLWGDQDVDQD